MNFSNDPRICIYQLVHTPTLKAVGCHSVDAVIRVCSHENQRMNPEMIRLLDNACTARIQTFCDRAESYNFIFLALFCTGIFIWQRPSG